MMTPIRIGKRHTDDEPGLGLADTIVRLDRRFRFRSWRLTRFGPWTIIVTRAKRRPR